MKGKKVVLLHLQHF